MQPASRAESAWHVLDSLPEPSLALDRAWRCLHANPAAAALLDTPRDALIGRSFQALFPSATGHAVDQGNETLADGVARTSTITVGDKALGCEFLPLDAGLLLRLHAASPAAPASETQSATGAPARGGDPPVLVWLASPDARCSYVNGRWLEFTGRPLEAELGDGWLDGVHPDDRDRLRETIAAAFAARQPFSVSYRLRRHDGVYRQVRDNGVPFDDATGNFAGYIGSCIDITDRVETAREREKALAQARASEAALRASRDQLRAIFCSVADGITVQDAQGRLLYCNDAAARIAGYPTAQALIDCPVRDFMRDHALLDGDGNPYPTAMLPGRRVLRGEKVGDVTLGFQDRATGETRWAVVRSSPIFDEHGVGRFVVNTFHDITERRRTDQEREHSERRFRALIEQSNEAIALFDDTGRPVYASPAIEAVLGYTPEEYLRLDQHAAIHPDDLAVLQDAATRVLDRTDEVERFQARVRHKDGAWRWIDGAITNRFADPAVQAVVINFRDITPLKRAEATLRFLAEAGVVLAGSLDLDTTLERTAALAVQSLASYCIVDIHAEDGERKVVAAHADPARQPLLDALVERWAPSLDVAAPTAQATSAGRPRYYPHVSEAMVAAAARGDSEALRLLRALRPAAYLIVPLVARGRSLGVIAFAGDQERGRLSEEDVAAAEELARRAALAIDNALLHERTARALADTRAALDVRSQFLSLASHELRTPLTTIAAQLEMTRRRIARNAPADLIENGLTLAEAQTARLARLVQELLDASRLERGEVVVALEPIDVVALTRTVAAWEAALEPPRTIEVRTESERCIVAADPLRLEQAIANLLENARKYSPADTPITVELTCTEASVAIAVCDRGIGIDPADHEAVFAPFSRGRNVDPGVSGFGLGLAIAREFVLAHGGTLTLDSAPGVGTTFTITLPLNRAIAEQTGERLASADA